MSFKVFGKKVKCRTDYIFDDEAENKT